MKRPVPVARRQGGAESDGRVPAEGHLDLGSKVAHPPRITDLGGKRRLGVADILGDRLHLVGWRQRFTDHDTCGISAVLTVGEGCQALHYGIVRRPRYHAPNSFRPETTTATAMAMVA